MAKLTRAEAALADRKRRLAALPKKSPAKVLAETFRPATRPEERERGEREQTSAALRPPAPVTPGGRSLFPTAVAPVSFAGRPAPQAVGLSPRQAFEQAFATALSGISGRAGVGTVTPLPSLGISGRAGVGIPAGYQFAPQPAVSGVAGVGNIPRPAPLQGHAYGVAGTGLVQQPLALQLPQAPVGVSGRAGVGLETGPRLPVVPQGISGRAGVGPASPTGAERNAPRALASTGGGAAPLGVSPTGAERNAPRTPTTEYNRARLLLSAVSLGNPANMPELVPNAAGQGLLANMARDYGFSSIDAMMTRLGYIQQPGTNDWLKGNLLGLPGGTSYGGGGGGSPRYYGYGGGGDAGSGGSYRGQAGGGGLVSWRIRYTA